ncbi:hypothetical protein CFIMG_006044RA [Ceratocystis fimbriata CBS 114723]|uniref:Uncharacterized protein n=1 Tax=Ceratocystis fimbriata CBS 114723 TaxID=1035309 RepID=A0A2C5WWQ2_9PEZI|nr:hypothetical protein CFIMG_006044RA [Ceratocystis fimbriata CBS 114723]
MESRFVTPHMMRGSDYRHFCIRITPVAASACSTIAATLVLGLGIPMFLELMGLQVYLRLKNNELLLHTVSVKTQEMVSHEMLFKAFIVFKVMRLS